MSTETPQKPSSNEQLPNPDHVINEPVVPEDVSSLTSEKSEKKRFSKGQKILAGLAGGALLAGGGIAIGVAANQAPAKQEPVATAPTNPGETDEPTNPDTQGEITVESIKISSETTPDQLGPELIDTLNEWSMAGANQDTFDRALDSSSTGGGFAKEEAEKYKPIFAEAIFGADWASDPGIVTMVDYYTGLNTYNIEAWMLTSKEEHPFERTLRLDNATVTSQDESMVSIDLTITDTNNAKDNRIGSKYNPEAIELDGATIQVKSILTKTGDQYLLTLYSVQS